ncbi:hypothetical protein C1A40_13550 [Tamlana carrageenivorans]|uniref:Uncharacterized protein n=1 Tax=Pseudotamlana carrageenivorans TaxID=2069432 RepID=A0A2I7SKM3_9FLAO|nr:hypothetical protein C1A40_13550 [Tamlana carrageenivorans]
MLNLCMILFFAVLSFRQKEERLTRNFMVTKCYLMHLVNDRIPVIRWIKFIKNNLFQIKNAYVK